MNHAINTLIKLLQNVAETGERTCNALRNSQTTSICESYSRGVTGGEYRNVDTVDDWKLLIVGDSAVRLLATLGARSRW